MPPNMRQTIERGQLPAIDAMFFYGAVEKQSPHPSGKLSLKTPNSPSKILSSQTNRISRRLSGEIPMPDAMKED